MKGGLNHTRAGIQFVIPAKAGIQGRGWDAGIPVTGYRGVREVKDSARYVKLVEWSDEDQCYVGTVPGLFYGGCHGSDKRKVFDELCVIVEEVIALYKIDNKPLPLPNRGHTLEC